MNKKSEIPVLVTGIKKKIFRYRLLSSVFISALSYFGNPIKAGKALKKIHSMRQTTHGVKFMPRYIKAGRKYYLSHNLPAWPSPAFRKFLRAEFHKIKYPDLKEQALHSTIFSITARCKLKCEHCYESANISSKELLSKSELFSIMEKLQSTGICHIQFSGGEPLTRLDDLLGLLEFKAKDVDAWILTSGYDLTPEVAARLKDAGLTGALISLDHWDEDFHNRFRKDEQSFFWAEEAARNCRSAGIVTALSLCATKEFTSPANLMKYLRLAGDWNIGFLRILEPRAVGSYKGKKVLLSLEEKGILEDFFILSNTHPDFINLPSVMYPGYYQKRTGCFGGGDKYVYVDSKGEVHACPFCQGTAGNILKEDMQGLISNIRSKGCHMFAIN